MVFNEGTILECNPPAAGHAYELILPVSTGRVHRLVVKQIDGSLDGFTAELLNSDEIYPVDGSSGTAAILEHHRVIPQLTAAGSAAVAEYRSEAGAPFANVDGTGPTNRPRELYIYIDPASTGDTKNFTVSMLISHSE